MLAIALTLALQLEYWDRFSTPEVLVGGLITLPLGLRLRFPLPVLIAVVGGIVGEAALGRVNGPEIPVFPIIALTLALLAVGARSRWPALATAAVIGAGGWFAATQLTTPHGSPVLGCLITVSGLLLGRAVGVLRFESDVFTERATQLERERDERIRLAVAEERQRIARELHDVIGHSISVMGVQAGAVRSVLTTEQQREREALLGVERVGREAIAEMRRLIGLLRPDESPGTEASATLRSAPQLVGQLRQAGLDVELALCGDLDGVPAGLDLAGFRILQEALTNALQHAPGSRVRASVRTTADRLELLVVNDHTPQRDGVTMGSGHGLIGMHERAALYGGKLSAGLSSDGTRFEVRASLPLETT
jgi:signal transduction histidine kinase